ncbi:MAG: DNA (cytosine-5-)-methyltransferase [Planctomycetota bacterium]|nr:DNA (cytosine-5-)-methyltransferase [Planctomycetota bacterium]
MPSTPPSIRIADLFAGLGGFYLAAKRLGAECVFACEIEESLRDLYERNHGLRPAGDIREIEPADVPEHDVLCAGFPCQPFSKAGDQSGFRDKSRGAVLFRIPEILRTRRPKYLIMENVPHFIHHDSGRTYAKVRKALEDVGYEVDCREYSPLDFGIPQIRERVYMVGQYGGFNGFRWPEKMRHALPSLCEFLDENPPEAKPLSNQVIAILETWQTFLRALPLSAKLPSFPIWSMEFRSNYPFTKYDSLHRVPVKKLRNFRGSFGCSLNARLRKDLLLRLPSHARADHGAFPRWKQQFIRQNRAFYREHRSAIDPWLPQIRQFHPSHQKFEWNCQGEERDVWKYVIQLRASGVRLKRPTTAPSLVAMTTSQVPIIAWQRRYMTMRECARLQSMDSLQYLPSGGRAVRAVGNAVCVEVAYRILEALLKSS